MVDVDDQLRDYSAWLAAQADRVAVEREQTQTVEVTSIESARFRGRRWWPLVAVAAALILVLAAVVAVGTPDAQAPADQPTAPTIPTDQVAPTDPTGTTPLDGTSSAATITTMPAAVAPTVPAASVMDDLVGRLREPVTAFLGSRWSLAGAAAIRDELATAPVDELPNDARIGDVSLGEWVRAVVEVADDALAAGDEADLADLYELLVQFVVEVPEAGPPRIPGTGSAVAGRDAPAGQYVTWRPTPECTWDVRYSDEYVDRQQGSDLAAAAWTRLSDVDGSGDALPDVPEFTSDDCGDWFRVPDDAESASRCGWCSDAEFILGRPIEGVERELDPVGYPTPWPPPRALVASVPGELIGQNPDEPYELYAGRYQDTDNPVDDGALWVGNQLELGGTRQDSLPTPSNPIVITSGTSRPPAVGTIWYYLMDGVSHPDIATLVYALPDGRIRSIEPTDLSGRSVLGYFILPQEVTEQVQDGVAWIIGLDGDGAVVAGTDDLW